MAWTDYVDYPHLNKVFYARIEGVPELFASTNLIKADGTEITSFGDYTVKPASLVVSRTVRRIGQDISQKAGKAEQHSLAIELVPGRVGSGDPYWLAARFATEQSGGALTHLVSTITDKTDLTWSVNDDTDFGAGDLWISPGVGCATYASKASDVITVTGYGKYDSYAGRVPIGEGITAKKVYVSNYIRSFAGRYVKIFMTFADANGRLVAATLEDSDSVEIFRGIIKAEPSIHPSVTLQCVGVTSLLEREICRDLAKSTVILNANPSSYFLPDDLDASSFWGGRHGAIWIGDNNKIPIRVTLNKWDGTNNHLSQAVTVTFDDADQPAPTLYDADGAAEVRNCLLFSEQLIQYIVEGLDNVSWSTYSLDVGGTAPDFAENLGILVGYGVPNGGSWGTGSKGLTEIRWKPDVVTSGSDKYFWSIQFLWDKTNSCGPALGYQKPTQVLGQPGWVNASFQWPNEYAASDVPMPAVYIPRDATSVPVVVPDSSVGAKDFPSSGTIAVQDAICTYTGYSAVTYYGTTVNIPSVKVFTGLTTKLGERKDISVAFSDGFIASAVAGGMTLWEATAGTEIYAETETVAVKQVVGLFDVDLKTAILTLACSKHGDTDNGSYDTLATGQGAGIWEEHWHETVLAQLVASDPWAARIRTIVLHKKMRLADFLEGEALLNVGSFGAYSAPTSGSGAYEFRLGFLQLHEPSVSVSAMTLDTSRIVGLPETMRADTNRVSAIEVMTDWNAVKGEHDEVKRIYNAAEIDNLGPGETVEIKNYDVLSPARIFDQYWLPRAKGLISLYGEPIRIVRIQVSGMRVWKLREGMTVTVTCPFIPDPTSVVGAGVSSRRMVVAGIFLEPFKAGQSGDAELVLLDFRSLNRANYSPVIKPFDYDSGPPVTVSCYGNTWVASGLDNPLDPGTVATDLSPYNVSDEILVYEVGDWSNGQNVGISAIAGTTITINGSLSAGLISAITGETARIEFIDYDNASSGQLVWAYQGDTAGVGSGDAAHFVYTA